MTSCRAAFEIIIALLKDDTNVGRSSKRDRLTLMENKFERPRARDARCFEYLPNLRGDVRYKERRPVCRRHRSTK